VSSDPSKPSNGNPPDPAEQQTLLQFPTDFPLKIMGKRHDDFAQIVLAIVLRHAPDFDGATMEMRTSAKGNYLSLTCTIRATSKQQLDDLYRELSSHPMISMVL